MSVPRSGWSTAHFLEIHDSRFPVALGVFLASCITLRGVITLSLVACFHDFFKTESLVGNDLSKFLIKINLEMFISFK